jgi:hypothetical protein
MKSGDLVLLKSYDQKSLDQTGESHLALCYDPNAVTVYDHGMHRHVKCIKMICDDGRIGVYPVNEWTFDVIG